MELSSQTPLTCIDSWAEAKNWKVSHHAAVGNGRETALCFFLYSCTEQAFGCCTVTVNTNTSCGSTMQLRILENGTVPVQN